MRVLITGGRGYIGSSLLRHLTTAGGFSGTIASRVPQTLTDLPQDWCAATIDWTDPGQLLRLCRDHEAIVHLAAGGEAEGEADPEAALRETGLATLRLVEAAARANIRRLVSLSTAKVYGQNPAGVVDESTVPRPITAYAITHRLAEDYVLAAHDRKRLTGVVLRLSNAIGPPPSDTSSAWTTLCCDLCRQATTRGRIVLTGTGEAWRNLIAMNEVARAINHVLTLDQATLGDGLFNLGGPHCEQIIKLAGRVARRCEAVLGHRPEIERPAGIGAGTNPAVKLDYRSDRLAVTGFVAADLTDAAIDATLRCPPPGV